MIFNFSRSTSATRLLSVGCQRFKMVSSCSQGAFELPDVFDLPRCNGQKGPDYLHWVSELVSTYRFKRFSLSHPDGATLTIKTLEDTMYRDRDDEVTGWGKFYLTEEVKMLVVGTIEGTSCPCDEFILMTCEDKKLYAYDGEEILLVAPLGLNQLRENGLEYPASKTFYKGEAFKHMTKEDWAKVRKGEVGRRLDEEHLKQLRAHKSRFLQSLRNNRHRTSTKSLEVS